MSPTRKTPLRAKTRLLRADKPMRKVSAKTRAREATAEGLAGKAHMACVAQLPCVVCHTQRLPQNSATQVHHCIHGRYSARKAPDTSVLPLCEGHHMGDFDTSKVALHRHPSRWKRLYGEDTDFLPVVADMLAGDLND